MGMTTPPRARLSPQEYVELEQELGAKHEYHDGRMFAMAGGSSAHALLPSNLAIEVGSRVRGTPCRVYSSDLRVVIETTGTATYPDLSVVCGDPQEAGPFRHSCINPAILFEVLSPGTERYDRGATFEQYRKLGTLREYVLVAQDAHAVDVFRLENGHWVLYELRGPEAVMELNSVGARVPLRDLYSGVRFEDADQG